MDNENLTRDEAAVRSRLLRVDAYTIALDLRNAEDPQATGFRSRCTITFTCAEPGSSTFLDFLSDGVEAVELNGVELDVDPTRRVTRIQLDDLRAHNTVTVDGTARYSRSGEGLHRFVDPADGLTYLYTQFEPADARRVFANFEQPDLKASFTFSVQAPSSWSVASNAVVGRREDLGGDATAWYFEPTSRISTYITTVLAGPYHHVSGSWHPEDVTATPAGIELGLYCRKSLAGSFDPEELFDITRRGLTFFHGLFDYPYPFGKYDQAFVPEYNLGAMENPGMVTFTEDYVFRSAATAAQHEARANTILHEMAHMWFGDLVTMVWWDDLWLKESFADYMGALAVAEATRWDTSWISFANKRKAWAYVQDQLPTTHPIVADIPDLEAAKQNFDGITYAKGAAVLKQLVAFCGFDAFIAASRSYFRKHEFSNTTLADFLDALADATGEDMSTWARQWLQTSGVSTLQTESTLDDDGAYASFTVRQDATDPVTGEERPRAHTVRLGLYSYDTAGDLVRTASEQVTLSGTLTRVPALHGVRQADLLIPNDDDLTYAQLRFDERSQATLMEAVDRVRDPLARATCLAALWSTTRDAHLSPEDYLTAVERAAPRETGVGVLQVILANARTAIERLSPAAVRPALRHRYATLLEDGLTASGQGSDLQLAWARALAGAGRSSAGPTVLLRALLDGTAVVPGLKVDAELRWMFLQALAAHGLTSVDELENELASDNTAFGRVGFTLASAAFPDPAVKQAAWQEAMFGNLLSNDLLSATIEGFTLGGVGLSAPFDTRYFDSIADVWQLRGIEMASRAVRGLYPGGHDLDGSTDAAAHPAVRATDRWLAGTSTAPLALRRIVIEERDHLLRALRAQQAASPAG
ncbi:aminopeptidase N [Arthrobacter sp. Br18]|uniref:aminopeptidase N n=1 Tax=Arthrobacter sp. Br18 TaxID=1312954 RepID=UPI00047DFCBA|nr:aminopeptidase N [Arthrobacter sp. Br18]